MLREAVIGEAMHALGIPTTRALAVVATGENVFREAGPLPGAVLTRVAASHLRVGTFEYAARNGDVRALADYAIARHYPGLGYLEFFEAVVDAQARLVAAWMLVGFIHGVMNTDNMAISGETIDYGPCAFMDRFDPDDRVQLDRPHGPLRVRQPAGDRPVEPGAARRDVAALARRRRDRAGDGRAADLRRSVRACVARGHAREARAG